MRSGVILILCAKCVKPVELFEYLPTNFDRSITRYRVRCHGEEETRMISHTEWEQMHFMDHRLTFFAGSDPPAGGEREGRGT